VALFFAKCPLPSFFKDDCKGTSVAQSQIKLLFDLGGVIGLKIKKTIKRLGGPPRRRHNQYSLDVYYKAVVRRRGHNIIAEV
jgi:hypothetical protein